jgi:hypothetical protein
MWQHSDVSMQDPEVRLTADEYVGAAPDAFGDVEIIDGPIIA